MPPVPKWAFKPVFHTSDNRDENGLPAKLEIVTDYIYVDGTGKTLNTKSDSKYVDRDTWLATHPMSANEIAIYAQIWFYKRTVFICVGVY
jgi:hypothetical protein